MEENIKVMKQLLSEGGKEPNQDKKKLYYRAIYQMLTEEGFTESVQDYMSKGFRFVKMGPFKAYFVRQDDPDKEKLLNELFISNFLRKDNARAFNSLVNLLALFISGKVDYRYCKMVMKELPNYYYNKEGKVLGTANGAMMNNFYSELTVIPANFVFEKLFDNERDRSLFETLLTESIAYASSVRKPTTQQKNAVEMVREWISEPKSLAQKGKMEIQLKSAESNPYNTITLESEKSSHTNSVTTVISSSQEKPVIKDEAASDTERSDKEGRCNNTSDAQSEEKAFNVKHIASVLEQLINRIDRLDTAFERSNGNTSSLIRSQQAYIDDLKSSVLMEKENSGHIRHRNLELSEEVRNLQKEVEVLRKQLVEKEEEARSLNALLEVSSKEGDRKFRGEILKLTEKLRFEYQDYISAKSIPMSVELGENMRGQLGDVFAILKKSGLEIDS